MDGTRFTELKKKLLDRRSHLDAERGARDQMAKVLQREEELVEIATDKQVLSQKSMLFLLQEIAERRRFAIESIEKMGSAGLRLVYGAGYKLKFEEFEAKRKEGASNYRMEIKIASMQEGTELLTGLMDERGGGLVEVVAFALRIAALNWMSYNGPLILDEAWKSMSRDEKLPAVARFLRQVSEETQRQVIFVTHHHDIFKSNAHRIIQVEKVDGLATVHTKDIVNDDEMEEEFS